MKTETNRIRTSKVSFYRQDGFRDFAENYQFVLVQILGYKKTDDSEALENPEPEKYMGMPCDSGYADERDAEGIIIEEDDEEDTEKKSRNAYAEKVNRLSGFLKQLRADGADLSQVYKSSGRRLVMIDSGHADGLKARLDKNDDVYEYSSWNRHAFSYNQDDIDDLANLLINRSAYIEAKENGMDIPPDELAEGYQVFVDGAGTEYYDVHPLPEMKNIFDILNAVKNSFVSLYIKNGILQMKIESYYNANAAWYSEIENKRIEKVSRNKTFNIHKIADNRQLLVSDKKAPLSRTFAIRSTRIHFLYPVRTASGGAEDDKKTKGFQADRLLFTFNRIYRDIAQLQLDDCEWTHIVHSSGEDTDITIEAVNHARHLGKNGLHLFIPERDVASSSVIQDVREELTDLYQNAYYKSGDIKLSAETKVIHIPKKSGTRYTLEARYQIGERKYESEILRPEPEDGSFYRVFVLPETKRPDKIRLNCLVSKPHDVPLYPYEKIEYYPGKTRLFPGAKSSKATLRYQRGMGIRSDITESSSFYSGKMNLCIIKSKKADSDQLHSDTECLSVQHATLETLLCKKSKNPKESRRPALLNLLCEMGHTSWLIDQSVPYPAVEAALYCRHIAKTKTTASYTRYFYFDSSMTGTDRFITELLPGSGLYSDVLDRMFPDIGRDKSTDQFAIKTKGGAFYFERTGIVAVGTSVIDQTTGAMLPQAVLATRAKHIPSIGRGLFDGYYGISSRYEDGSLYYIVGNKRRLQDIQQGDIMKFPHVYRVSGAYGSLISEDEFASLMDNTFARIDLYSVLPPVIKLLKEWSDVGGRTIPPVTDFGFSEQPDAAESENRF